MSPPTTPRLPVDCARCGTRHYGEAVAGDLLAWALRVLA